MKRKSTLLAIAAFSALAGFANAALYIADFSVDGEGATHTTTDDGAIAGGSFNGQNWTSSWGTVTTDTTTNEFITAGGVMVVQDWGGSGSLVSQTINITSNGTVDFVGTAITVSAGDAFNAASEGFEWFYVINSGTPVTFGGVGQGFGGSNVGNGVDLSASAIGIAVTSGDTVQFGFNFNVDGADDGFHVSSMEVIPEPSAALLGGLGLLALLRRRR